MVVIVVIEKLIELVNVLKSFWAFVNGEW